MTLLFVFVLVFTLVADVRLGRKLFAAQPKRVKTKRIEIEPPNAWVVNKSSEERLAYKVPKSFLANHPDYMGSDLKFRITCDDDVIPVEGTFSIDDKAQILFPPHILVQINKSQMIRFEILD
ncbi:MAG: hypothetical protein HY730_08305 [Candidatus Tectomicrobia bacterium]|uniref:Uncharacterized protein n=1 Tax=Tectimicrobiota bacterium TaxID=2528274 RepID=A0A933GM00_UNCTE|nr:hypothetical protein [Candidatus Tectomicrobia bacterium]